MEDIMWVIKFLGDFELLLKGVSEKIQTEVEEQKRGFPNLLLGTLGASLLGNLLKGKGKISASEGTIRAGCGSKRSLTNDF